MTKSKYVKSKSKLFFFLTVKYLFAQKRDRIKTLWPDLENNWEFKDLLSRKFSSQRNNHSCKIADKPFIKTAVD